MPCGPPPLPYPTAPLEAQSGYVVENARQKALEVMLRLMKEEGATTPDLVIGSDTVVVGPDGAILEKPGTPEDAVVMLAGLSGKVHHVFSGVALVVPGPAHGDALVAEAWHSVTEVHFAPATTDVLQAYVDMGESLDKAGGYGIQSAGALLVARIVGDYNNVKGFPLFDFAGHLAQVATQHMGVVPPAQ